MTAQNSLPWIGEFKAEWKLIPNKALIRKKKVSVGLRAGDYDLLSLTKQGVIVRNLEEGGKFPENFDSYQRVQPGDLVTCLFDVEETPRTIGIAKNSGMITGAYDVFEFTDLVNPRFFEYYYLALDQRKGLKYFYSGLRNVIKTPTFLGIPMPLPPREEQDAIVEFLDRELAQVDKLIEMQRSLISLASEHLEANILDKVTGQEFMSARVHHPNLAWFPNLPEGWTSTTIRHFAQVFAGGTPDRSNPAFWEDGQIPWINSGSVNQGRIAMPSAFITEAAVQGSSTRLAPKGALVIALAGQGATKGTPAMMEIDAFCNQSMAAIVCDGRVDARYLYFWLRANYLNIRSMGGGDLRDGLNLEHVKSITCPIPPKSVQVKIAEELEGAVIRGNRLREQLEMTITKLLERRAAVISAAVTGKLKLKGLADG